MLKSWKDKRVFDKLYNLGVVRKKYTFLEVYRANRRLKNESK